MKSKKHKLTFIGNPVLYFSFPPFISHIKHLQMCLMFKMISETGNYPYVLDNTKEQDNRDF